MSLGLAFSSVFAQEAVRIDASKRGTDISPYIYGQFIEHLGRCIYGGIWSEMLEDRKFHDSLVGQHSVWHVRGDAWLRMNATEPFVGKHSPELLNDNNEPFGLVQNGLRLVPNKKYVGYVWAKPSDSIDLHVVIDSVKDRKVLKEMRLDPPTVTDEKGFRRYAFEFQTNDSVTDTEDFSFGIIGIGKGSLRIGTASLMPGDNVKGMRPDVLALLKELDSPVYRWPGGNFVSGYDWNDGIGDRDRRPPRKNPAWRGIEHNDFGLDEFMVFCDYLKTEPYIAVNSGAGDMSNAVAELEYANGSADTSQGKRRAANGHPDPYKVKFWGIGNEMYGDWQIGHMPVEKYAEKHNRFAEAFRKADPNAVLVAVGDTGRWDETIMRRCANHMDLISEHFYVGWQLKPDTPLLKHIYDIPANIKRITDAQRKYRKEFPELKGKDIRIAMDEWNYWYGPEHFGELGTRYFVKDGLGIAAGLHEYFRNSDIVYMANYAQTVNVIGCIKTSKTRAQFETTGLVLKLYRQQYGTVPLFAELAKPLDASAALTADGKTLTVGIVNPTDKESVLKFDVSDLTLAKECRRFEIAGKDPMEHNDPNQPQKIDIVETTEPFDTAKVKVAPYSVTLFKVGVVVP